MDGLTTNRKECMFTIPADVALDEVLSLMKGRPAFVCGSAVTAETYNKPDAYSDVDVFVPTPEVLVSTVEYLLNNRARQDAKFHRIWEMWLSYGVGNWHTHSMKLFMPSGVEINIISKKDSRKQLGSLTDVLESFDFGILATGYDTQLGYKQDLRPFLFPNLDLDGPLPMLPTKSYRWKRGQFSKFNALREIERYVKYIDYGYDLSAVRPQLIEGYWQKASDQDISSNPEAPQLKQLLEAIAIKLEDNAIDELREASKAIEYKSELATILEAFD